MKKSSRIGFWLLLLAAAIALYLYFEGGGFGIGLGERGESADREAPADAAVEVAACELRLDASGLSLVDRGVSVEEAAAACAPAGRAILKVTGDALYGDFERTQAGLTELGIDVATR
jgi:hypothetical protein